MMKWIPDSLSPQKAWELLSAFKPLDSESKKLVDSLDHVLAENVVASHDVPQAPRSFMDGYAVRAQDVRAVPVQLRIAGEVLMGQGRTGEIGSGETKSIPTGGFLPSGADAVVMQEDTQSRQDSVIIRKSVSEGENVQAQGEDFRKGALLFESGHRLRSQDLAAMATFGIANARVVKKPKVSIFSTGNELVPYESSQSNEGLIRETNSLALATAAQMFGFRAEVIGIIEDETEPQKTAMTRAIENSDVVLVSGGSSVGLRDYTLEVIRSFPSHQVHFHGLAIRPGNPTIFASIGQKAIFGLPGQPVSSLVVFYQFVLPFLFHLSGRRVEYPFFNEDTFLTVRAILQTELRPLKLKTDYVRIRLVREDGRWLAIPVLGKSASLSTLSQANGFTVLPPGDIAVPAATIVNVHLFP